MQPNKYINLKIRKEEGVRDTVSSIFKDIKQSSSESFRSMGVGHPLKMQIPGLMQLYLESESL